VFVGVAVFIAADYQLSNYCGGKMFVIIVLCFLSNATVQVYMCMKFCSVAVLELLIALPLISRYSN